MQEAEDEKEQDEGVQQTQRLQRFNFMSKQAGFLDELNCIQIRTGAEDSQIDGEILEYAQEKGEVIASQVLLEMKDFTRKEKIQMFNRLLTQCHQENFVYFFILNYKYAKLCYQEAESLSTDSLQSAGRANNMLQQAKRLIGRAKEAAEWALNKFQWSHGKDEKLTLLADKIGKLDNNYGANVSLLEADERISFAVEDFGEMEDIEQSDVARDCVQEIVDQLVNEGLKKADDSQDELMRARINAKLGKLLYKFMFKGRTKLQILKAAKKFYSEMLKSAGVMQNSDNPEQREELVEQWFLIAKQEDLEIQREINELTEDQMNAEEKAARAKAKPIVEETKAKFDGDTSDMKLEFIRWFNDRFIPEDVRKPIPTDQATLGNKRKFARWYIKNISAIIHPDNYQDNYDMKIQMQELAFISNKIVNRLKGNE